MKKVVRPRLLGLVATFVVAVMAGGLGASTARASLVMAMDLEEMTTRADRVVVGEVLSVKSAWEPDHKRIFTNIEIRVADTWKGTIPLGGKIIVQQPGGQVGDIESRVYGLAHFREGDRAVLFLKGTEQASAVLGLGQGMRSLRFDESARKWMVAGGDRRAAVRRGPQGRFIPAEPEALESLETLRARVLLLVKR
jgi:hypothetical protein